ncbi:uroporphyrinogen-III synthase [Pacificimonas flava]|uniref:Uroporphyrinogen-III synthase n=1 Tax=Pacificimonas flava TaxID=1234595 RepID=M2TQE0_9SPHN|nr:uroporphyrinogen-III synthase [Pacificimonas flava]EMD83981.1 Uroporphyrinogen-III synthase [Pacificimonas flava]MBB5281046.1 uroporphyrinogen-III synthase [Pacificimonas flava]
MRILVTRPAAQAAATAARLRAAGHEAMIAPLVEVRPVRWTLPQGAFDALVATSANAFLAGMPVPLPDLPLYAVGKATATAARAAGFTDVRTGPGGGAAPLYRQMEAEGVRSALHLAGERVKDAAVPDALTLCRVTVYAAASRPLTAEARACLAAGGTDWTLLYSAAAAQQFAAECVRAGLDRTHLSAALLGAPPAGFPADWRRLVRARIPTEDALFAAAGLLCE